MNRILVIAIVFIFINTVANSQNFINAYTNKTPGCNMGAIDRIATDNMDNVINASMYSGTIIVGNYTFTSDGTISTIIVKKDDNDSLLWVKSLSCGSFVIVGGIYTDQQSNIYITGYFGDSLTSTTLNSNPYPITIPPGIYSFVIKYAPDGTVLWSNSIKISDGTASSNADMFRICGNGTDRIAVSSFFYNVTPQTVGGSTISPVDGNLFLAVIDDNGNWLHATVMGGATNLHISLSMAMASNNDVFISGEFKGNLNLGSAGTLSTLTSSPQDFVCKADPAGNFVWAKMLESSSWWRTEVLAQNNDVFVMGTFGGTITLGSDVLTTTSSSTYLAKIDNAGNYLWAKNYGTNETHFYSATKNGNSIFITGYTSPYVTNNQFDTLHLTYATSLPVANTYSCVCFLVEADLNGNALKGAFYSFDFPTLNTQSTACTDSKVYLTGNVGSIAAFGGYVIQSPYINASNYIAVYTDSANILKGKTYYDFNSNNIFDTGDTSCSAKLTITKGSNSITTLVNGPYLAGVDQGTYISTITDAPLYYAYTPNSYTSVFSTLTNQTDSLNDFAFQPVPGQNDLVVDLVIGQLRPGFSGTAFATITNIGTTIKSGSMSVLLNHPDITITLCTPSATSINVNTAALAYNLNPTEQTTYIIEYDVATTAALSSAVAGTLSAPDVTDITPQNNEDNVFAVISGSFDPNSKEVFPLGNVSPDFISNGEPLEYIIHFQNTGNDTAFTVVLTDTISNKLDLSSFQMISSSHPVVVNIDDNVIWFRFYNIDLVDSIMNEPMSHGFVKYIIVPLGTCVVGDVISNNANIYFDYNTAVTTNTTNTTVEIPVNTGENDLYMFSNIFPNPTKGDCFTVRSGNSINVIEIYNALGRKVRSVSANNVFEITLATEDLKEGMYFINVISQKNSETHKLIIIR